MRIVLPESLSKEQLHFLNAQVQDLSRLKFFHPLLSFIFEWACILTAAFLCEKYFSYGWYFLAVLFIGTRQHAVAILAHDGVHGRLFKSRRANIIVSNFFAAYPIFFQIEVYAHSHLQHHRYTNEPQDPDRILHKDLFDWQFPMALFKIVLILISDFIGRGALLNIQRMLRYSSLSHHAASLKEELKKSRWLRLSYYLFFAGIFTAFGIWKLFVLYWVIPLLFVLPGLLRFRNMCEHYGLNWNHELQGTRDVVCGPLESFLLAPYNINFHLVHHLYPSIPYYNLKKMHEILMAQPFFKENAHINKSYVIPYHQSVVQDLTRISHV